MAGRETSVVETDELVKAWLVASLQFDHYSFKQLREIVEQVTERLHQVNKDLPGQLGFVKYVLRERTAGFIQRESDRQTHAAFEKLFSSKSLCFFLECVEARFEIPPKVEIRSVKRLVRDDNEPVQRSLFDFVADGLNECEVRCALPRRSSGGPVVVSEHGRCATLFHTGLSAQQIIGFCQQGQNSAPILL